jgi:hypothetical protein
LELAILASRQSLLKQGAEESDFEASGTIIRHIVPPLGIAVWTRLHLYSSRRINPNTLAKLSPPNRPLLYYASCFSKRNDNSSAILDLRIIKLLLDCSTDPNEEIKDLEFFNDSSTTPWRTFLRNVFLAKNVLHDNRDPARGDLASACLEVFELYLQFGADPEGRFNPVWRTRRHWYDAWTILTNLSTESGYEHTFSKPEQKERVWRIKQSLLDKDYIPYHEAQLSKHREQEERWNGLTDSNKPPSTVHISSENIRWAFMLVLWRYIIGVLGWFLHKNK